MGFDLLRRGQRRRERAGEQVQQIRAYGLLQRRRRLASADAVGQPRCGQALLGVRLTACTVHAEALGVHVVRVEFMTIASRTRSGVANRGFKAAEFCLQ